MIFLSTHSIWVEYNIFMGCVIAGGPLSTKEMSFYVLFTHCHHLLRWRFLYWWSPLGLIPGHLLLSSHTLSLNDPVESTGFKYPTGLVIPMCITPAQSSFLSSYKWIRLQLSNCFPWGHHRLKSPTLFSTWTLPSSVPVSGVAPHLPGCPSSKPWSHFFFFFHISHVCNPLGIDLLLVSGWDSIFFFPKVF